MWDSEFGICALATTHRDHAPAQCKPSTSKPFEVLVRMFLLLFTLASRVKALQPAIYTTKPGL